MHLAKTSQKLYILTLFLLLFSCAEDFDPPFIEALLTGASPNLEKMETIHKEDKLYDYLSLVSKGNGAGLTDVGCIEFIYPFVMFQFDEEDNFINQVSVLGNENFIQLLDELQDGYSIGLSYPISGNLKDGTPVNVNNNDELQQSLETCIEEKLEIILGACNSIVKECIWKVTESNQDNSPYLNSFFKLNDDGSVTLSTPQIDSAEELQMSTGTWIFYFIGPDLHLNINFGPIGQNDDSEDIKSDWNFDWRIICIVDDRIAIEKTVTQVNSDGAEEISIERIILQKECDSESQEIDCEEFLRANSSDSACCIDGKNNVSAGATEMYTYGTNIDSPEYTWQVISGDIEIIDGENSAQATFKFGDNFTSGAIEALGMGSIDGCGIQQTIIRNNLSCSN